MRSLNEHIKSRSERGVYQIYLASAGAFEKCCRNCDFLVRVEEAGLALFSKRVFCKAETCVK